MNEFSFNKKEIQILLNAFAFFIACPFLYILGNSIYFFIFLLILLYTKSVTGNYIHVAKTNKLFAFLFFSAAISSITNLTLENSSNIYAVFKWIIQMGYWCLIGAYFSSWFDKLNIFLFSKWVFFGSVLNTLFYFFIKYKINLYVININLAQSRNEFIFNMVCMLGMIFYYLSKTRKKRAFFIILPFTFFIILSTDGRAGAVITFIMSLLFIPIIVSKYQNLINFSFIALLSFVMVASLDVNRFYIAAAKVAPLISNFSPRVSSLLMGKKAAGSSSFALDKSWLIRQLMIDKGLEINSKYPILGIGLGNFTKYSAELKTLPKYIGLFHEYHIGNIRYYNKKSSHNSYICILAELGYLGSSLYLFLTIPVFFWTIKRMWSRNGNSQSDMLLVSYIGVSIYLYIITAHLGANYWLLVGCAIGQKNNTKNQDNYIATV